MGPNPTQGSYTITLGAVRKTDLLPDRCSSRVEVAATNWKEFEQYLEKSVRDKRQVSYRLDVAKQYAGVLDTRDAAPLLVIQSTHKLLFVKALSKLAKFQGRAAAWHKIRSDFGLSWKEEDDVTAFKRMIEGENIDDMIDWVRKARRIAPEYGEVLTYACLTGLRPAEFFLSLGLSNADYYNDEKGLLEQWRFPDLFIRRNKKAFVSVMNEGLLQIRANYDQNLTYNALRLAMRRNNVLMNMQYCRKIHGTYLKSHRVEPELFDLLAGRLPRSVFLRFYNRANLKESIDKVRKVIIKLEGKLEGEIRH